MKDADRVSTLRSFYYELLNRRETARMNEEPLLVDSDSLIAFIDALLEGRDSFEPDFAAFSERLKKLQGAPRYTVCIAMTGWKTLTPAPKPSTP